MMFKHKLVIVVRQDLKLSSGKLAVQVAHAAVSCAILAKRNSTKWFREWYSEGQKKVVVKVPDLQELRWLAETAKKLKLPTCLVVDAGLTEVPPDTTTCLGIGPGPNNIVDKVTGDLPLL